MISVIICSINSDLLVRLKNNIKTTINTEHEIIVIDNKSNDYSLASAYNYGASQAKYPYLCFIHQDILFHTEDWGNKLINHLTNTQIALAGILGCLIKTKAPSGVYIPIQQLNRVNQLQKRKDGGTDHYYENPNNEIFSEVATVDGMFLAIAKSNHTEYPFNEKLLNGFHGYDVDYSLGQAKNGKVVVIYDILIEHLSYGGNTIQWINAQLKVTQHWIEKLPLHITLNKNEILQAEITNTETFLMTLFTHNYKKHVQLKYLARLLLIRPFDFKNLYFIRKLLLFGRFERMIKTLKSVG